MVRKTTGTCTMCGKEGQLTILDDVDWLCDECLDSEYTQCDECGEYYPDTIEFFVTKDDRLICEHCREDFDDEDIDFDP